MFHLFVLRIINELFFKRLKIYYRASVTDMGLGSIDDISIVIEIENISLFTK